MHLLGVDDRRLERALSLACLLVVSSACSEMLEDDGKLAAGEEDGDPASAEGSGAGDDGASDPAGTGGGDPGEAPDEPAEGGEQGGPAPEPGQLTAGEWRDLAHWDFWLALFEQGSPWASMATTWGFASDPLRVPVDVAYAGEPVIDVPVVLLDAQDQVIWEARTDAKGRAELFAGFVDTAAASPWTVVVGEGEDAISADASEAGVGAPVVIETAGPGAAAPRLDLMFVVDTTGSMGDELAYLQTELADVIQQVRSDVAEQVEIRLSLNFYRDAGDEYVVRSFPFTTDIEQALGDLATQSADGGGDFPEAVHDALTDAIQEHAWSEDARARLLFLVLDAPAHDDEAIKAELRELAPEAAAAGIRVIPVAGSGMDKSAEFLVRFFAVATGGTYVFLTNDSGIGGEHLEPSIGQYQVELLNELLVRLVAEAVTIE